MLILFTALFKTLLLIKQFLYSIQSPEYRKEDITKGRSAANELGSSSLTARPPPRKPNNPGRSELVRAEEVEKGKIVIDQQDLPTLKKVEAKEETDATHLPQTHNVSYLKIAVAIPVYNRVGYVKLCAEALNGTVPTKDIWVFDDRSDKFSVQDLKEWFGTPNVMQPSKRLESNRAGREIVEWFVHKTDYDWVVTLDSDLIVRPDWLQLLKNTLPQTNGIISVYHSGNSEQHPTIHCADNVCQMKSMGNAGAAWSKQLATKLLASKPNPDKYFDWGWTTWLQEKGISQYATEESLVLHIGVHGSNGIDSTREKSMGFDLKQLPIRLQERALSFLNGENPDEGAAADQGNGAEIKHKALRTRSLTTIDQNSTLSNDNSGRNRIR
jgi:hypothetical protein